MKTFLTSFAVILASTLVAAAPVEHVYKTVGAQSLRLRVYTPEADNSSLRPALVLFHGGSWAQGSPMQLDWLASRLAERGWVIASVQYRLVDNSASNVGDCAADAIQAVAWVRDHAELLRIDERRIAVGGASAGGQLALAVALATHFMHRDIAGIQRVKPNAVIGLNPVVSVATGRFQQRFEDFADVLDPTRLVSPDLPPTLIFHGTEDKVVPLSELDIFVNKARAEGATIVVRTYAGKQHGFFNPAVAEPALLTEIEQTIIEFLQNVRIRPARSETHKLQPR